VNPLAAVALGYPRKLKMVIYTMKKVMMIEKEYLFFTFLKITCL
jgi:hypothetical protein